MRGPCRVNTYTAAVPGEKNELGKVESDLRHRLASNNNEQNKYRKIELS